MFVWSSMYNFRGHISKRAQQTQNISSKLHRLCLQTHTSKNRKLFLSLKNIATSDKRALRPIYSKYKMKRRNKLLVKGLFTPRAKCKSTLVLHMIKCNIQPPQYTDFSCFYAKEKPSDNPNFTVHYMYYAYLHTLTFCE